MDIELKHAIISAVTGAALFSGIALICQGTIGQIVGAILAGAAAGITVTGLTNFARSFIE